MFFDRQPAIAGIEIRHRLGLQHNSLLGAHHTEIQVTADRTVLGLDSPTRRRGAQVSILAVALVLSGFSLGLAVLDTHTQPAWARFSGVAVGVMLALNAILQLIPKSNSVRSWLWGGWIVAAGYAASALIARLA